MVVKYEAWPLEDVILEWFHHYIKVGEPFQKVVVNDSDPRINKYGNVHGNTQERTLEITNTKVTDGGSYTCFITVASVSTMVEFKVSIFSSPIIVSAGIAELSGFTASIDGRFLQHRNYYSIVCRAYGFPLPEIQLYSRRCLSHEKCEWMANESLGNSLRNSPGEVFEGTYETSFRLPVIAKQTGSYICLANGANEKPKNVWKTQEYKIIDFVVTDVPQAERFKGFNIRLRKFTPELTKENYATVFEKDTIALSCMYQKWYYNSVKWSSNYARNGKTRKFFTAAGKHRSIKISHEEGNFSNSEVLHIFHVSPEYSGVYYCSGTEGDSGLSVVRAYELVVQRPLAPFFHNENESTVITVQYSHPFELDCNASAFPRPKFEWLKNSTRLTPSPGIQILENGRRLKVLRAVKEDVGIYTCKVENRAGATERNYTISVEGLELPVTSKNTTWIMQAFLGMLGCFVIALTSVVIVLKRREQTRVKQLKEMYRKLHCSVDGSLKVDPTLPLNEQTEKLTYDSRYEVPKQCLQLKECLGVGQFGRVHKAAIVDTDKANTSQLTVAVKMPRVGKNVDHQSALLSELKIMVYLGFHPNVLSLVGAVTKHMVRGELYLITEFCSLGCLRDYVRQHSPGFVNELVFVTPRNVHPSYDSTENDYLTPYMLGKIGNLRRTHYQSEVDPTWADELARNRITKSFLCTTDLLSYSYQVANGMDFLASKNLIHRDLALRNLLLTENHLVKIGDFGLTRQDNKYEIKKLDTPLPIKWMAIESLSYREYTVKSDVWSFGIVLWEIFSHGTIPYTEHNPGEEFVKWLKSGNRLSQPDHSPEEIKLDSREVDRKSLLLFALTLLEEHFSYRLMRHCWLSKPEDRPDFAACRETIAHQLSRCNASAFESLRDDLENAQPQIIPDELRKSEPFGEPYCDFFYRKESTVPNDEPETSGLDNATYFTASTLQC
ncbi:Ig 2 and Pkinase Tyr and I-set domain containing protein [Trichuris trichiura]|uniref:receptor protein-tyrosine kinase n=1 Tax=Trichuris trichiura TaxID=36087 RepID=A0A077ZIH3_TRITR|nr:Ig 2 and Pkinase Tyr and I-set domain containing protein [Trichuris trichiura]